MGKLANIPNDSSDPWCRHPWWGPRTENIDCLLSEEKLSLPGHLLWGLGSRALRAPAPAPAWRGPRIYPEDKGWWLSHRESQLRSFSVHFKFYLAILSRIQTLTSLDPHAAPSHRSKTTANSAELSLVSRVFRWCFGHFGVSVSMLARVLHMNSPKPSQLLPLPPTVQWQQWL